MSRRRHASDRFASGPSARQLRVGEVLRQRLSEVLARNDLADPDLEGRSITVSEVRVSPDLRVATAFVMPLGGEGAEVVLAALRRNQATLRHRVVQGLALKFAPELRFELEVMFDQLEVTRRLFLDPKVQADLAARDEDKR